VVELEAYAFGERAASSTPPLAAYVSPPGGDAASSARLKAAPTSLRKKK